jgi:hypothetical protein
MTASRENHTATLLANGKVLVAGGFSISSSYLASAELYDPAARAFAATGSMTGGRVDHTATRLGSGLVLIVGGNGPGTVSAELYDPAVGTFAATGAMIVHRTNHTATLLSNGKVLIAGGVDASGYSGASAEIYE